ncbi:MAG: hypothetical protein AB7H48_09550, partial [Parachlamydiales bacterium]
MVTSSLLDLLHNPIYLLKSFFSYRFLSHSFADILKSSRYIWFLKNCKKTSNFFQTKQVKQKVYFQFSTRMTVALTSREDGGMETGTRSVACAKG